MKKIVFSTLPLLVFFFLLIRYWPSKSIEWHEEKEFRWSKLHVPTLFGKTGFKMLSESKTGITFTNTLTEEQIKGNRVLLNGSGVALGDVDADGRVDIYFCRLNGPNVLYRNLGNWQFEDITHAAGVACAEQFSSGATFADLDGDGDLDLLVTAVGGPNACFINDGSGTFTDVTEVAGLTAKTGASTIALADIDCDNDLDLYITNYKKIRAKDIYTPLELGFNNIVQRVGDHFQIAAKFKDHYTLEIRGLNIFWFESGEPDRLYVNDGTGKFNEVPLVDSLDSAVDSRKDWGLMARFQDMDADGDPDLYVCNDFESPDRIWINDGRGRFQPIAKQAIRHTSNSSMAVDFSDIDRDGDLDFVVVDMLSREHRRRKTQKGTRAPNIHVIGDLADRPQYMRNTLFLNRGDNSYAEIAHYSDLQASEWSWSAMFLDVDLDGYEDILITTGNYYDAQDLDTEEEIRERARRGFLDKRNVLFMYPKLSLANIAFRNRKDLTFEDASTDWGFNQVDVSHGMAFGDLDNDGDLDVVINRFDKPAAVYRNETTAPRIAVRLKGLPPNTQGIGAKIRVLGGPVPQSKEVVCGGAYLSHSDPLVVFAAGVESDHLEIEVTWRNGRKSQISGVKRNRIYEIHESGAREDPQAKLTSSPDARPLFEDVSHLIQHLHHEDPYDDFWRQPLLPRRLSQLGPGIAWYDLDGDGDDELIVTSGKGGQFACFRNDQENRFSRIQNGMMNKNSNHEQAAVLGWTKSDSTIAFLVGYSNFEDTKPSNSWLLQYEFRDGMIATAAEIVVGQESIGPMAMADYDGDRDLDLFVGGRSLPGRYPEPANSYLFKNNHGRFTKDESNTARLENIGMVTGAAFSDIDADADPDLILSMEWGPITIFRNENGRFEDVTQQMGLADFTGWWNGVTTGDFNEDGKLDIVATNWGLNSKYTMYAAYPLRMYYRDFNNNGILDIIEAYFDPMLREIVPERGLNDLSQSLPMLRIRTATHKKFANSRLSQIIGPGLQQAGLLQANTLAHMIFINKGDYFETSLLPQQAQLAPAFYVGVADFDGDGHQDIFLSQNFFASEQSTPRCDAGRGLILRGDGSGHFDAVPGQESGITVYGEQRGAALSDFDKDGRTDIAVSQNGAETKLYRNQSGKPGLRVKLLGPPENLLGIGATIRLIYADGYGPACEVHAGSGYWSQDSAVQVMGKRTEPTGVWVRWPDGKITRTHLPSGISELIVGYGVSPDHMN